MPYLLSVPDVLLREIVREEHEREDGFSARGARLSLLLDVERGDVRSQRAYARIWRWSRGKVRNHWDDLWQDVARWVCSYGRQLDHPLVGNLPGEWVAFLEEQYLPCVPEAQSKPDRSPPGVPEQAQKSGSAPPQARKEAQSEPTAEPNPSPEQAHYYISNPDPGKEDDDDAREREEPRGTGSEAWFLDGTNVVYRATVENLLQEIDPGAVDALVSGQGAALPSLALRSIHEALRRRYGPEESLARLAAALVITNDAADHPNVKFLHTTLQNFHQSHEEAEEASRAHQRRRRRSVHQRQPGRGLPRTTPPDVYRSTEGGALSFEENLRASEYSEREIRALRNGGPVFDPPPPGHGAPQDAQRRLENGKAHGR